MTDSPAKSNRSSKKPAGDSKRKKLREGRPKEMTRLRKAIGALITEQRKEQRYTIKQLAGRAGVNVTYLGEAERGNGNVTVEFLAKICRVLNISMRELIPEEKVVDVMTRAPKVLVEQSSRVRPAAGASSSDVVAVPTAEAGGRDPHVRG